MSLTRVLMLTCALALLFLSACGRKDETKLTYAPPLGDVTPLKFSISRREQDLWTVGAEVGIRTLGTFGIEETIDRRDDSTYIIFRNRNKGTDQVFVISSRGYVSLHTTGEHRISIQRADNELIIDDTTLSGTIDVEIIPDTRELLRIAFDYNQPLPYRVVDFTGLAGKAENIMGVSEDNGKTLVGTNIVFIGHGKMTVEYVRQPFIPDELVALDSLKTVVYVKKGALFNLTHRELAFHWNSEIEAKKEPLIVDILAYDDDIERVVQQFQDALAQFAPQVTFERQSS